MNTKIEIISNYIKSEFLISDLERDTQLIDGGYLDSIQILDLVSFIEQQFDLVVEAEDMRVENFASVEAIMVFLSEKN